MIEIRFDAAWYGTSIKKKKQRPQMDGLRRDTLLLVVCLCPFCSKSLSLPSLICVLSEYSVPILKSLSLQSFEIHTTDIAGLNVLFNFCPKSSFFTVPYNRLTAYWLNRVLY